MNVFGESRILNFEKFLIIENQDFFYSGTHYPLLVTQNAAKCSFEIYNTARY